MNRLILAALACVALGPCWAGLGGAPAGGAGATLSPQTTASGARYTRVQQALASGTTVEEWVDAGGKVFAVSWSGPFMPDLRSLLGDIAYDALVQEQAAARTRSSSFSVQRPDLVIVSTGRMGAFRGQAWLPARLPAGLDPRSLP